MKELIYFLTCLVQPIFLPIPEAVTVLAGSVALGSFKAFILGFLGTTIGILIMYFLSVLGAKKIIDKLVNKKHLEKYKSYVKRNEILFTGLLFIFPILPDEIVCVGAGITGISLKVFLPITILSKLITSFTLAYSWEVANVLSLSKIELMLIELIILILLVLIKEIFKLRNLNKKVINYYNY